jgi:hypothetical protein
VWDLFCDALEKMQIEARMVAASVRRKKVAEVESSGSQGSGSREMDA